MRKSSCGLRRASGSGKVRISTDGGDDRIMVAGYTVNGESFETGEPRTWSDKPVLRTQVTRNFDLAPAWKRMVVFPRTAENEGPQGSVHVTLVLNFFDELRRRLPAR